MLHSVLHLPRCVFIPSRCADDLKRISLDPLNLPCLQEKYKEPPPIDEILLLFDSFTDLFDFISFWLSEQFLLEENY